MKILYISPENTVGTMSLWKKAHEMHGNTCDFITFYKSIQIGFDIIKIQVHLSSLSQDQENHWHTFIQSQLNILITVVVEILTFQTVQADFCRFINQHLRRELFTMGCVNTPDQIITEREVNHILQLTMRNKTFTADHKTISQKVSEER